MGNGPANNHKPWPGVYMKGRYAHHVTSVNRSGGTTRWDYCVAPPGPVRSASRRSSIGGRVRPETTDAEGTTDGP
jgi:hypothetical protein